MVLRKVDAPPRARRRRWGIGGVALTIILCLVGIGAYQLNDQALPQGIIWSTPLAYAVSDLAIDQRQQVILAIYGGGVPLPSGHHFVIIALDSGRVTHDVDLGVHLPAALAVDGTEGRALVIFSDSTRATLLDTNRGRPLRALTLPFQPFGAVFDQDNGDVVVSGLRAGRQTPMVAVVDPRASRVVRTVVLRARGHAYGVGRPVVDRAAGRLLIATSGGVNILDARSLRLLRFTALPVGDPDKIVVDPQAHRAYVTLLNVPAPGCPVGSSPCVRTVGAYAVVDERTGILLSPHVMVPGTTAIGAIALSIQRRQLFIADYGLFGTRRDARVYVMDVRTGRALTPLTSAGPSTTLRVDDLATALSVGGPDGLAVFDTRTQREQAYVPLHVARIWGVSGQGNLVVSTATYATPAARTTPTGGGVSTVMNQIATFLRAAATRAGRSHPMNSGVSVVRIGQQW